MFSESLIQLSTMLDGSSDFYHTIQNCVSKPEIQSITKQCPYVSIMIPTYRRIKTLREAVLSAINQFDVPFEYEIIVVDNDADMFDCCDNPVKKMLEDINSPRLSYYINSVNIGMFGNWNRCIQLANGEWVAFLHDDDLLWSNYLQQLRFYLNRKKDIGAIVSNYIVSRQVGVEHFSIKRRLYNNIYRSKLQRIRPIDSILNSNVYGAPTCGCVFRKCYAIECGGFDQQFYPSADWFFLYKFNMSYKVYKPVATCFGTYRIQNNESLKMKTIEGFIRDAALFREYFRNHCFLGRIIYFLFHTEQHYLRVNSTYGVDVDHEKFNDYCIYQKRPVHLFLYKFLRKIVWYWKMISALIFG